MKFALIGLAMIAGCDSKNGDVDMTLVPDGSDTTPTVDTAVIPEEIIDTGDTGFAATDTAITVEPEALLRIVDTTVPGATIGQVTSLYVSSAEVNHLTFDVCAEGEDIVLRALTFNVTGETPITPADGFDGSLDSGSRYSRCLVYDDPVNVILWAGVITYPNGISSVVSAFDPQVISVNECRPLRLDCTRANLMVADTGEGYAASIASSTEVTATTVTGQLSSTQIVFGAAGFETLDLNTAPNSWVEWVPAY